jgi:hypothetical protein
LRRGARRSMRRETYVVQFREPCASLGHANPLGEHNQLRHITAGNWSSWYNSAGFLTLYLVTRGIERRLGQDYQEEELGVRRRSCWSIPVTWRRHVIILVLTLNIAAA